MIAVDTNVLVRLLVQDDAAQAARARAVIDAQAELDDPIWVSDTVLVELVWTLARAYGRSRDDQALAVKALAAHGSVVLESPLPVEQALVLFARHPADFSDCLLAAKAAAAGCTQLVTLDRSMKPLPAVQVLPSR